jgi:hypothetical protein
MGRGSAQEYWDWIERQLSTTESTLIQVTTNIDVQKVTVSITFLYQSFSYATRGNREVHVVGFRRLIGARCRARLFLLRSLLNSCGARRMGCALPVRNSCNAHLMCTLPHSVGEQRSPARDRDAEPGHEPAHGCTASSPVPTPGTYYCTLLVAGPCGPALRRLDTCK